MWGVGCRVCLHQFALANGGLQLRGFVVTEAGAYVRLIDSCITQLKAQGPSGTCNESKEEEEGGSGFEG